VTSTTTTTRNRIDIRAVLVEGRAFIALIGIVIIFSLLSDAYLTVPNLVTMTKHVAMNAILALGMLTVILNGGIDLSVGSTMGLSGMTAGYLLQGVRIDGLHSVFYPQLWLVLLISCAVGTFVGWLNGVIITRFKVTPFITTLGMMYAVRGAAMLITNGTTFPNLAGAPGLGNEGFWLVGGPGFFGIPMSIWIMAAVALLTYFLVRKTQFGRWLYASGGNERAAELSGVPVRKVTIRVYMIAGLCAAIAGLIAASELTSAAPQTGTGFELNAIAAVVIGGASLMGGRGSVRGALVGAFVIGFLSDGLVIVGVSTFWQQVIMGGVIIVAVGIDQAQQRVRRGKKAPRKTRGLPTSLVKPDAAPAAPTEPTDSTDAVPSAYKGR
jgi:erythritol transport system permease protein